MEAIPIEAGIARIGIQIPSSIIRARTILVRPTLARVWTDRPNFSKSDITESCLPIQTQITERDTATFKIMYKFSMLNFLVARTGFEPVCHSWFSLSITFAKVPLAFYYDWWKSAFLFSSISTLRVNVSVYHFATWLCWGWESLCVVVMTLVSLSSTPFLSQGNNTQV